MAILAIVYAESALGQSKHAIENGCIVKVRGQGYIRGSLVNQSAKYWTIVDYEGDSNFFNPDRIAKVYMPHEITLFKRNRFHYKEGILCNHSLGLGLNGVHWNLSLNRRFSNKYELGFGIGSHFNRFSFNTPNTSHSVAVHSFPIYAQGKYMLRTGKKMWYGKLRLGWANNTNNSSTSNATDGMLVEGGLGLTFKSRRKIKRYLEFTQYFSKATGTAQDLEDNALSDIGFKVWFVNFMVTYGIEIGR